MTIREQYENEPPAEETISQSEPQLQNTDVGPLHRDEASAATSAAEHQQPEPSQTSTRNRKQPYRYGEPKPTNLLKKGGGCDSFEETSRKLEVFFIKLSRNERKFYLTNFVAMLISNGHKPKLNSNFVLALSLSY